MKPAEQTSCLVSKLKEIALVNLIRNLACRLECLKDSSSGKLPGEEWETFSYSQISETLRTSPCAKWNKTEKKETENSEENSDVTKGNAIEANLWDAANFVVRYDELFAVEYMARNKCMPILETLSYM